MKNHSFPHRAPGRPGIEPRWTHGAKVAVGTAYSTSREDVLCESRTIWDGESSAYDVVLYGHSHAIHSKAFQSLLDPNGSPILLLDSTSRVAFVLHHLLGYKISDAAGKARLTEKQYRAQLRRAYLQLASFRFEVGTPASHGVDQSAPTGERNYELVEMDSCFLVC